MLSILHLLIGQTLNSLLDLLSVSYSGQGLGCGPGGGIRTLLSAVSAGFVIVACFCFPPHCLVLVSTTISVLQCRDMCISYAFFLNINIITVKAITQEIFGSFHSGYLNPISG